MNRSSTHAHPDARRARSGGGPAHQVQAKAREKYDELQRHAQATYRAVEGWHLVPGRETWAKTYAEAQKEYLAGTRHGRCSFA